MEAVYFNLVRPTLFGDFSTTTNPVPFVLCEDSDSTYPSEISRIKHGIWDCLPFRNHRDDGVETLHVAAWERVLGVDVGG